ncbi:AAA family ATPase, partial [Paramuribaculum intestinale]
MILKEIHINGFKNIAEASLCFSPKVNALLGNNGMGKSNLLDAIYFLSFCKSFSGMTDAQIIRRGDDFAMVRAT